MVNPMVERATSNMLIGPDWAMNIEICDICNQDPTQAKDIVKGLKKRLRSRNPKTQLLALTLLETIVKNCSDIVHMYVAEKELPRDMVKMLKKKPEAHVREKILVLIDTWQEAFGGPRARYPQFFAAYQELLRLGAVFPQRSESSAPVFTPLQSHPLASQPQNLRNPESSSAAAESSAEAETQALSATEIQNARGIVDVLSEMLNALEPGNKEGAKQEVILDLVEQCRSYKHRVVHLVNSTVDELLLRQGLSLNDDLQRVLAKHESIASGTTSAESETTKPKSVQSLVNVDAPLIDTGDQQSDNGPASTTSLATQLLHPAPDTNGQVTALVKVDPSIDLLSGDGFNAPTEMSNALVPVGEPQSGSPVASQQNALALLDMYPLTDSGQSTNPVGQPHPSSSHFPQQANAESSQTSLYLNGSVPDPLQPNEQSFYSSTWNGQMTQQEQPPASPGYGAESSSSFPPPPWEAELDNSQSSINEPQQLQTSQAAMNNQAPAMYIQSPNGAYPAGMNNQTMQSMGMYPQSIQPSQMGYMYPQQMYGNQAPGYGYGYGQRNPHAQYLEQGMNGLSMRDRNAYVPSGKPMKPEDKLFGDLVDLSKFKGVKNGTGSM